jgi:FixJ family two-component response regulator
VFVIPLGSAAAGRSIIKGPGEGQLGSRATSAAAVRPSERQAIMIRPSETKSAEPKQIVFVVDDDIDVREGLQSLLLSVSLGCEVFASAREFLSRKASDAVSCLILDVRLPGSSGLDFQAELAKVHNDIPIIFITGHGDIPMTVRAMKAGAIEFLTKPVREQDLLDAVRLALKRDRQRRENDEKLRGLAAKFESLSERERQVLSLVTTGMLNKQMAGQMNLSEVTVKVHRHNLMKKMGAKSLPELVKMAEVLRIATQGKDET